MIGCSPPITRRAVRSVSSYVVTTSRRSSSVAAVEVILIFLCFVAFFTLAVYPIFNHTVTFRLHN